MILQALKRYYDILVTDPEVEIASFGYSKIGINFALNLSGQGELLDLLPLFVSEMRGKKRVEVPLPMMVPQQNKRTSKIEPNFLWDQSAYVLGMSEQDKEKPSYSADRFKAFREFHRKFLADVNSQAARAVLAFLDRYDQAMLCEHPAIQGHSAALATGVNLVFRVEGVFAHLDPAIRSAWEQTKFTYTGASMQCLVTGEQSVVARLHQAIKGVRNAQPSGATLVGFNADAYESYGRSQGSIAPVGEAATAAYTTVLNHLLSNANPNKKIYLGDTTVVYWAESANRTYETVFAGIVDPDFLREEATEQSGRYRVEALMKAISEKIQQAGAFDLDMAMADLRDENPRFYILGLAPNVSRLSVRFFVQDLFEEVVQNILRHYDDLRIVKEFDNQPTLLSVNRLLSETVSKKSKDQHASPLLAGAVMRSILTGAPYPAALYSATLTRIRAEMDDSARGIRKINYARASIIKAFLLRKYRYQPQNPFQEVLIMGLNERSAVPAYLLGRLFAVLEKVQLEAIGNVNASIKDRYFTTACASPRTVFPTLLTLAQRHIAKAQYGYISDRRIQDILNLLDVEKNPIPSRLTLDEQGVFVLGYYHQRAAFYTKEGQQPSSV